MSTALRLGPADVGRVLSDDEFMAGDYEEGYRYELIFGRLSVSPQPNFPHHRILVHVNNRLNRYAARHPDRINYVAIGARVFVPGSVETTAPQPDIAAYRGFPTEKKSNVDWREVSPLIVIEVLSESDVDKDLIRNVDLYYRVRSIQEYWVFDLRENPNVPPLIVHRRQRHGWQVMHVLRGSYRTELLPGFRLPLDPDAK